MHQNLDTDTRDNIDVDNCIIEREEAEKLPRRTRLVYQCPICNKMFDQRGKFVTHLGSKYLCSQRVTLEYLRKEIKDNQTVTSMTDQMDELINEFLTCSRNVQQIDHIATCKLLLRSLKYRYKTLLFNVRIIALHDYNDIHKFDSELAKYSNILAEIHRKYALLIF